MVDALAECRGVKDRSIAIRNVYVMMAYSFQTVRTTGEGHVEAEEFEHLHDLMAAILSRGVSTQVKRGLHRDYIRFDDRLTTVRGRIDMSRTAAARAATPGSVVCSFDEYEHDTPFNQALKSVIVLLLRHGQVAQPRKDALRRLLPYLESVTLVSPGAIRWNTFTYHRTNASYRMLLGVCELVVRGMLQTEESGATKLRAWLSDEAMSSLYERFLREYYAFHHPDLSPRARLVTWDYDDDTAIGTDQLPTMRTDVTLRRGNRTLIVDAKYYGSSMQTGMYGKSTVHSANLYQMLAYTKNEDVTQDGSVSGLLLYARTDAPMQPNLDVTIQGNRIGAQALNLNRPWQELQAQLERVLDWLKAPAMGAHPPLAPLG